MSSVTVGYSPQSGHPGSRRNFMVRNSIVSASTSSGDGRGYRVDLGGGAGAHDHCGACGPERLGQGAADAPTAARDDRDPIVEDSHVS